jgi:hypothetical protein
MAQQAHDGNAPQLMHGIRRPCGDESRSEMFATSGSVTASHSRQTAAIMDTTLNTPQMVP